MSAIVTTLRRTEHTPEGTFGFLEWTDQEVPIFTVERPWRSNRPWTKEGDDASCIPTGTYLCVPRHYHKGDYPAVEVTDVPGRTHILFHRANLPSELAGCIALGLEPGRIAGERGVLKSAAAWEIFKAAGFLDWPWTLTIL